MDQYGSISVVSPGINVSPIVMPSGGVSLGRPEGTGGCSRRVSLIAPLRCSAFMRSLSAVLPDSKSGVSSLRSFWICVGSLARL
jgi:hypothetical protein